MSTDSTATLEPKEQVAKAIDRLFRYVDTHAVIEAERPEFALKTAGRIIATAAEQGRWGDVALWLTVQAQIRAGIDA